MRSRRDSGKSAARRKDMSYNVSETRLKTKDWPWDLKPVLLSETTDVEVL
jgi:hypothetical protein